MPGSTTSLRGQFLIAMPDLLDPNFHQTVTLICEHREEGAFGLVLNRCTDVTLEELLAQLIRQTTDQNQNAAQLLLHSGGPVQPEQCLVLHQPLGDWEHTWQVGADLGLTGSLDIFRAIAVGEGPQDILPCLGYAGWGAGQLEQELLDNSWLTGPADTRIIFSVPVPDRWQAAATLLGIDLALLSNQVGHS